MNNTSDFWVGGENKNFNVIQRFFFGTRSSRDSSEKMFVKIVFHLKSGGLKNFRKFCSFCLLLLRSSKFFLFHSFSPCVILTFFVLDAASARIRKFRLGPDDLHSFIFAFLIKKY